MCDLQCKPLHKVGGTNNKCSINDLSDEILLHIFSHITPPALLLSTLSNVCLRWKSLCSDFSLYRALNFNKTDPEPSMAVSLIRGAPWLRSLELSYREDVDTILCHLAEYCPLLDKLSIIKCQGSLANRDVSSEHLRQVMTSCTTLRTLTLICTSFTDTAVYGEIGCKLPSLTSINFTHLLDATDTLLGIANHCVGVEEMQIASKGDIDNKIIRMLCEKFSESLRNLWFSYHPGWTDSAIELLTKCQKLDNIYVSNKNGLITEDGLKYIALMPNIKRLELFSFKSMSCDAWVNLLRSPNMKNLKVVDMCSCNVNYDVVSAISVLPNVEKLNLGGPSCVITDSGLLLISDIPKLVDLLLSPYESVSTDGWKAFVLKPSTKNLTRLTLLQCKQLDDCVALLIMEHLVGLKKLWMDINSKLSEGMKTTLEETMLLRGCDFKRRFDITNYNV